MRSSHSWNRNMARNTEKPVKFERYNLGPEIWRETVKNEKYTLYEPEYGKKSLKLGK